MTGASPDLLDIGDYTELTEPVSLAEKFENTAFAKWNAFRETEDSRYVALALPRMLLREPYGKDTIPVNAFSYEEGIDGKTHGSYLWGNAAWALGSKVTQAFAKYNWCATIRGVESGGLVEHLPVHNFKTDSGNRMKCPTEVQIPDRREKSWPTWASRRSSTRRECRTPHSSACSRRRNPKNTRRIPRRRTQVYRRRFRTYLRFHGLRII